MAAKGTHKENWFIERVGKPLQNTKTKAVIWVQDELHAKALTRLQQLDANRYIDFNQVVQDSKEF